jgi:flavin reductase (DIM6/NTAB) family NADH-FMN oxidoreductase RutF
MRTSRSSARQEADRSPRVRTAKKTLPLGQVYGLLEPGPVALISTVYQGRANVMTQSWHMAMEFEPPLVGLIISDRNLSFAALRATGECVINIPTVELAQAVVGCGNCSGRDTDKFSRFGLTQAAASVVRAPLIEECYANLESRVVDGRWASRYGLFVVEVLKAWVDPAEKDPRTLHHRGRGAFMVAGRTIKLPSKMK